MDSQPEKSTDGEIDVVLSFITLISLTLHSSRLTLA